MRRNYLIRCFTSLWSVLGFLILCMMNVRKVRKLKIGVSVDATVDFRKESKVTVVNNDRQIG